MSLSKELEEAINECIEDNLINSPKLVNLMSLASRASGYLSVYERFDLKQMTYDLARMSGMAGYVPEDFDEKATS